MVIAILLGMTSAAPAAGVAPQVAIGPDGSRAIKLEVGDVVGDGSWMWLPFATPIDLSVHPVITVSFDIYRDWAVGGHQQLVWGWVTSNDQWVYPDLDPSWGIEEVYGPYFTYPFGFYEYADYHAYTVFDDYATITLQWDFANGLATASYDGGYILINTPFTTSVDTLYGWDISLNNVYDTGDGAGEDIVWIDNFVITGSDIYNSNGFEGFTLGDLNGQDGWTATSGSGEPVPVPATMLLLGSGMIGLAGVRRRVRKK